MEATELEDGLEVREREVVQILALPLGRSVTLSTSLNVSVPQSFSL